MSKKLTQKDVLEEMLPMLESIVDDFCDMRYFQNKFALMEHATNLYETTRRAIWQMRAEKVDLYSTEPDGKKDDLPF